MPNRILRDGILSSESVSSLGWAAEVFYRRLMSVVDDHGRFHSLPKLIRSACYPLHIDTVSDADIEGWLAECTAAGLVCAYQGVDGKRYLLIEKFGQQVRAKSKFPEPIVSKCEKAKSPDITCEQVPATAHLDGDGDGDGITSGKPDIAKQVLEYLNEKAGRSYQPVESSLKFIRARLDEGATEQDCRSVIDAKVAEWADDEKWSKYLRPETLFNATKFAGYVGQLGVAPLSSSTLPREKYL